MKKMMFLLLILISTLVHSQGVDRNKFGININLGGGFANNIRMADYQNMQRDAAKILLGSNITVNDEKNAIFYGGFDIEPRFYMGNLILAPSIGFYNTIKGVREVNGNLGTYYNSVELKVVSLKTSIYYKIGNNKNFILLGGGLGFYNGKLDISSGYNGDINVYSGSGSTFGWHSIVEYDHTISNFVLNTGILSRFVEIYELEVENNNNIKIYDSGASLSGSYLYVGFGFLI